MVQKLASVKPPLVAYRKHQGVTLTQNGRRAALEVIRHHRLLETWLVRDLGYSWDEVHDEAEQLEHAISEDLEQRISSALGNPARDPHGEPIPSANLIMPNDGSVSLSSLAPGQEGIVRRVQADDAALLKHLATIGLLIGARLKTLSISRYDQVIRLQVHGQPDVITLGPAITRRVFVEIVKKPKKRETRFTA